MTDTWTIGYDCTAEGYPHAPAGPVLAGYTTGSGSVPWIQAMWDAHPDAVRICQDAGATDTTADVLDVEQYAATIADVVPWAKAAIANFKAGKRPGQRRPLIYASASLLTPIANALVAAALVNGEVGFWVAHWGVGEAQAIADVVNAGGNWPIHAFQFANTSQYYDSDIFSDSWLADRSVAPVGPDQAVVPDVAGLPGNEALVKLEAAGLKGVIHSDSPVLSQTPGAGAVVPKGSVVDLGV